MKNSERFKDNLYYIDIELPPQTTSTGCSLGNIVQREQTPSPSPGLDPSHIYGYGILGAILAAPILMACAARRKSDHVRLDPSVPESDP